MPRNRRRKPNLADAMMLVAGVGVGCFLWRRYEVSPILEGLPGSPWRYYIRALGAVTFLAPLSLVLLVMALRRPRPGFRRVVREPAAVVGLSVLFVLGVNALSGLVVLGGRGGFGPSFPGDAEYAFCRLLATQTGMAVASAWFVRVVAGRRRWPRGWMDVSAGVLGACWFALALASSLLSLM